MYPRMNLLDYLHLQLRLEGKEIIRGNLLTQVEVVPDASSAIKRRPRKDTK